MQKSMPNNNARKESMLLGKQKRKHGRSRAND